MHGVKAELPSEAKLKSPADFKGDKARMQLSGAACAKSEPALQWCITVNDEKNYAQFFSIAGDSMVAGPVIPLSRSKDEADLEAAAYDPKGYFYLAGSHGRSRKKDKDNLGSYVVFRFPVDAATGRPPFRISEDNIAEAIQRTNPAETSPYDKLGEIMLSAGLPLSTYVNKPLAADGANIEGLAVNADRLWFGFRGPVVDQPPPDHAFLLSIAADSLVGDAAADAKVYPVPLGTSAGIRDLAAVSGGLLILSGPENDQEVTPAIWLWEEGATTATKLRDIDDLPPSDVEPGKKAKAETIAVLEETPEHYRLLVLFEGARNGAPREYTIPR